MKSGLSISYVARNLEPHRGFVAFMRALPPLLRARPGAQVSAPFAWDELASVEPDALTMDTVVERFRAQGDPWSGSTPQSLEPLLELSRRDTAAGLVDAPWPPVYPKMPGEPPRVAPSRARKPR